MSTTRAISQFKSHCLEIIEKLQSNKQSIIITKRNKPIAKVESIIDSSKISLFGLLKGKAEIKGDILESIEEKWDAAHE